MKLLKIIAAVVLSIALIASGSAALGVFSVDRAVSEDSGTVKVKSCETEKWTQECPHAGTVP